ncbi:MAG: hypothetical protein H7834_14470 [Magnetococcus sp. YQC-9]
MHATTLLEAEAHEERINALYSTLKMLDNERRTICGQFMGAQSLTPSELNWVFRPPTTPLNEHEYFAERLGVLHGRC